MLPPASMTASSLAGQNRSIYPNMKRVLSALTEYGLKSQLDNQDKCAFFQEVSLNIQPRAQAIGLCAGRDVMCGVLLCALVSVSTIASTLDLLNCVHYYHVWLVVTYSMETYLLLSSYS